MKQDIHNFFNECVVCQRNKGEIVKSLGTLQLLLIPPTIWRVSLWILLQAYPNWEINQSSWWLLIAFTSILIYVLFNTHLYHPRWLNFSWIRSSSFMACHILLFLITTQLSPAIFGKSCSSYKAPNCISAQLIIPRLMVKQKLSTSVWKHI
jgi:hypothetical protein